MQFSERMAHIKPSATLTINAKALELKSQGVDVTSLAIGEPEFPTPAHVCDAAKQAIDEGFTRYTAVPLASRPCGKPFAGYFKRAYGVDVAPDCTIASNGGKPVPGTTCSPPCSMTATKCLSPRRTGELSRHGLPERRRAGRG